MTDTPKPLTSADLADLKAKAKAATPTEGSTLFRYEHGGGRLFVEHNEKDRTLIIDSYHRGDREFYYAANPETILRLIDMIERREEQIERLRMALMPTFGPGRIVEYDQRQKKMNIAEAYFQIICEALAATEPPK